MRSSARRFRLLLLLPLSWVPGGCAARPATVLGKAPSGAPVALAALVAAPPGSVLTLRGTMNEKCPVAGCWFKLTDGNRTVRVDTNAGGFVVTDVALRTLVTVQGKVVVSGAARELQATGIRY